jgi:hypothetical protein
MVLHRPVELARVTVSGTERSRARTEFRLHLPEPINKSPLESRGPTLLCNQVVSGGWPVFSAREAGPLRGGGRREVRRARGVSTHRDFLTDFVFLFRGRFFANERREKGTSTAQLAFAEQLASRRRKRRCGHGRAEAGKGVGKWQQLA